MATIEIHARLTGRTGGFHAVKRIAGAIVVAARQPGSGVARCDWYANDAKRECVAMIEHATAATMQAHYAAAGNHYQALLLHASGALDIFGAPDASTWAALEGYGLRIFQYADRLGAPAVRNAAVPRIEIYTGFAIQPGQLAQFKRLAVELTNVVRAKDLGTTRYDWFYNDAQNACIAMDTYVDAPAMFAHMKNCHDAHEKLLPLSTMTTEFLGELPDVAMQAVAKYQPYILKFLYGLQSAAPETAA
jgi:quinol monooxygenase YgiN